MEAFRRNSTRLAVATAVLAMILGIVSVGTAGADDVYVTPSSTVAPTSTTNSVPVEVQSSDLERPSAVSAAETGTSGETGGGTGAQVAGAVQTRGGALAFTGSDAVLTAVIGAVVIAIGGALLVARRRTSPTD